MASRTRLAQAYYDLATMLDAGVPVLRSLDVVIQGRQGRLKQALCGVRESLAQGLSLAEAMGNHRKVFPDMDRMLVEAAETAGSLGDSFKMLSQWHEFIFRITRRIQMGLIYPLLILHIGALVFGLPDLVLGRLTTTGYLLRVASILLLFYIPAIAVILFMRLQGRAPAIRYPLDFLVLRIPILGSAIYHLSICRYAKAFSMLYKAGVPIYETAERAAQATGNMAVARMFEGGVASIRQGGMAWEGYSKRLPAEYLQLWQIGEESGELDKTIDKIAEISADRADLWFSSFAVWMPWFVYALVAAIIVFMIFRLFLQVYGNLLTFTQ
jgi:type II secretory pathway component PulF